MADLVVHALGWGLLSAASLPLGALVAVAPFIADPSDRTIGLLMSFGGGSLLFAVTVEMFAEALREIEHDPQDGPTLMYITIGMSVVGALVYIQLNRLLSGGGDGLSSVAQWRHRFGQRIRADKYLLEVVKPLMLNQLAIFCGCDTVCCLGTCFIKRCGVISLSVHKLAEVHLQRQFPDKYNTSLTQPLVTCMVCRLVYDRRNLIRFWRRIHAC